MNSKHLFLYLLLPVWLYSTSGNGQVNFLGKPGLVGIPTAHWEERKPLGLSFGYLPNEYSIFNSPGNRNIVHFYNARLGVTSFMEVYFTVAHRPLMADQIGVGDRQLDFRFRLLEEKEFWPAVVLGWTPPGSVSPVMAHDYLVLTKNIKTSFGKLGFSGGYGSPYVFTKGNASEAFMDIAIRRKTDFLNGNYLTGFFGGISYEPIEFGGVILEYDTQTINTGIYIQPTSWLLLQGYTFEGKEWGFSFAFHLPLNFAPRTLRNYEKDLE